MKSQWNAKYLVEQNTIVSPTVGYFRAVLKSGDRVFPGRTLGYLDVLNAERPVLAPNIHAVVKQLCVFGYRCGVEYNSPLYILAEAEAHVEDGLQASKIQTNRIEAPIGGRFFRAPSPGQANFANTGDLVSHGDIIGLLEVMKTFHYIVVDEKIEAEQIQIEAFLVEDGSDVSAGDAIVSYAPVTTAETG